MANIFTYGTLQEAYIQESLFKRKLVGKPDTLLGYTLSDQKIAGLYPFILKSSKTTDSVSGIVYQIEEHELKIVDDYEGEDYERILIELATGTPAWVYIGKTV